MSAATLTAPAEVDRVRSVIARAQAGDRTAFGELYQRYQVTVYRYVYRKVGNPTVAEDLTSEVFVRALRGINGFAWQGKDPVVWLVTIAANLIRDHFRLSRTRLEVLSDDAAAGQQRRDLSSGRDSCDQNGPEEMVLASLNGAALREAITQLTPAQQQCLALRFFEGLDTHETAERMDITARAVVSLQYRAIQALRDLLPASVLPGAEPTGRSTTVAATAAPRVTDRTQVAEQPQTTPVNDDVVASPVAEVLSPADVDDTTALATPVVADQDAVEAATTTTVATEQVGAALSGARRRVTRNSALLVRIGDTRETDSSAVLPARRVVHLRPCVADLPPGLASGQPLDGPGRRQQPEAARSSPGRGAGWRPPHARRPLKGPPSRGPVRAAGAACSAGVRHQLAEPSAGPGDTGRRTCRRGRPDRVVDGSLREQGGDVMLARLAQSRQVTCPDCKGEGYVAASASEWEPWFRAYTQAQTHHQDVLQAYLAGTATRAELDAAVGALTDVVSSPSAELADGTATVVPLRAAWSGGACESCGGYGVQPRQRRIIARPRRLVARPAA